MLLVEVTHIEHQEIGNIGGALDLPATHEIALDHTLAKLNRGFQLGSPAYTDTGNQPLQFGSADGVEAAQPAGGDQQPLGGLQARHPGDDGQQFGIG